MALLELNGVEITFGRGKDAVRVAEILRARMRQG